jgi:hypothetical protein
MLDFFRVSEIEPLLLLLEKLENLRLVITSNGFAVVPVYNLEMILVQTC